MIIIEAGATSTKVCYFPKEKPSSIKIYPGISPIHMQEDTIKKIIKKIFSFAPDVDLIHYYGTGCLLATAKIKMKNIIKQVSPSTKIFIYSDLLAAARGTAGIEKGQINILGTGSASCLYDGKEITNVMLNTGYLFGDYGSGYDLGRSLLKYYFENKFSLSINEEITAFLGTDKEAFIQQIYAGNSKAIIANLAKFTFRLKQNEQVQTIIMSCFNNFIENQIKQNPEYKHCNQFFTGSIAHFFHEELSNCLSYHGLKLDKVCKSPLEELSAFHLS